MIIKVKYVSHMKNRGVLVSFEIVEFPVNCGHEAVGSSGHSCGDAETFNDNLSYGKIFRQRHQIHKRGIHFCGFQVA